MLIQCAILAKQKSNMDVSFVPVSKICITNFAKQNTTRNLFQFWKMVTLQSVTAATDVTADAVSRVG
jgi:hypothetical protein